MNNKNPLQKYFRQAKIHIDLPSKGAFYEEGSLEGRPVNIPIYGMTGMDEIIMKTPDALFTGDAVVKTIESCCPTIKNAWKMPSIDVDCLLASIRIATFGAMMSITHRCPNCQSINDYEIDLSRVIEYLSGQAYDNKIICDDLVVIIRPLRYEETTEFNIENYKLQKMLGQLNRMESQGDDDGTIKSQNEVFQRISNLQLNLFEQSIEAIETPDGVVTDKAFIKEWIQNSDKEYFKYIKNKLEQNKAQWDVPQQDVTCPECEHQSKVIVTLDQSSFFERN
jgi:hypothetical protein